MGTAEARAKQLPPFLGIGLDGLLAAQKILCGSAHKSTASICGLGTIIGTTSLLGLSPDSVRTKPKHACDG